MTFANPLLESYTVPEKSPDWPVYNTKTNYIVDDNPQNTDKFFYQQPQPYTRMILNDPPILQTQTAAKVPKLKLEMEMFSDLSTYCQQTTPMIVSQDMQNNQDELNTPTFELRAPLDFDRQAITGSDKTATILDDQSPLKIKSELSELDNLSLENSVLTNEDIFPVRDRDLRSSLHSSSVKVSDDSIVSGSPDADSYGSVLSPEEISYYSYANDKMPAPVKNELLSRTNSYEKEYDFTIDADSSVCTDSTIVDSTRATFPTPENSREPSPVLRIDVNQKYSEIGTLQTPDIIDSLEGIACERDFNILSFINDEDIKAATDLFPTIQDIGANNQLLAPEKSHMVISPLSPEETHNYALPPYEEHQPQKRIARKRRIKTEEDDDEDYVPPSSKRRTNTYKSRSKNNDQKRMLLDMEIHKHIMEELGKTSRRGRPPKSRVSSISSDSSEFLDSEGSKYREMRDKNNEASRRSRFKRKLKEKAVENEAEELAQRNIKLKAQVEELEKTVTTFRNNLMKLLLTRK